ncbi:undecaprenyl-diphosphate phosphatase [Paenibacillaceae bacterium]|nr:undecaprenyl-diphosphate phosphatase [Paenibacillaceae bacterium]
MDQIIELLKYAFLGILQGATEPIPISSSGHLIIAQELLGIHIEGLSFEILVNFASLIAVLYVFRKDIIRVIANSWRFLRTRDHDAKSDFMFAVYVVAGSVPTALIVFLLGDAVGHLKSTKMIGFTLLLTGIALWLIRNLRGKKADGDLKLKDAILVGIAQGIAILPGISRSGSTIVASMAAGMKRDTALRYSFFLYIPVSFGAMILSVKDMAADPGLSEKILPYSVAFLCSLVASLIALRWFIGIMAKGNLLGFAIYCWIVGTAVLIFL